MASGTIKKLVQDKGFGFIKAMDGADVFFHHSCVADRQFDTLSVGQPVEYEVDDGGTPPGRAPEPHP